MVERSMQRLVTAQPIVKRSANVLSAAIVEVPASRHAVAFQRTAQLAVRSHHTRGSVAVYGNQQDTSTVEGHQHRSHHARERFRCSTYGNAK
jgi:hypothetical protein